jgi:hypothetical protein
MRTDGHPAGMQMRKGTLYTIEGMCLRISYCETFAAAVEYSGRGVLTSLGNLSRRTLSDLVGIVYSAGRQV